MMSVDGSALMRAKEVCRAIGVSRWTLVNLNQSGVIRGVKIGGQMRYCSKDVAKLTSFPEDEKLEGVPPSVASEMLRVSPRTITRMADDGKVRSFRTPNGHRRIIKADLERLMTQGMNAGRSPKDAGTDEEQG